MTSKRRKLVLNLLPVLILVGCSGSNASRPAPTSVDGAELFSFRALGRSPGCVTCHSLAEGTVLVGPSLFGVGTRAANRVSGMSARDYIRQSIVEPRSYVVDGFTGPKMPDTYRETLTAQQVDTVVDYLVEQS